MNKRLLALALAIISLFTLLTACSGGTQNETNPANSDNVASLPTIREQLKRLVGYKSTFRHASFDNSGTQASSLSDQEFEKLITDSYEAFSSDERFITPNA